MSKISCVWKQLSLASIPAHLAARSSHSLSVLHGRAYIFGGELEPRKPIGSELIVLDLKSGEARVLEGNGSMPWPSARVGAAMVAHPASDSLYLWGGRGGKDMKAIEVRTRDDEQQGQDDVWRFDAKAEVWSKIDTQSSPSSDANSKFPEARSFHTMAQSGNSLYVHAGCPSKGRLTKLNALDLDRKRWSALPDAPEPARGGTVIVAIPSPVEDQPNLLIRWGGFCGYELGGPLDVFDPATKQWKSYQVGLKGSEGEAPAPRSVHGLVPLRRPRKIEREQGGKEAVAVLFMGEGQGAPAELGHDGAGKFLDDIYILLRSQDAYSWLPVASASGSSPRPRGWFGYDVVDSDSDDIEIVIHGGLQENNERLGDVWTLRIAIE